MVNYKVDYSFVNSFLVIFSCCFFLLLQFVIRVYHSLVYVEEYIGIGIYISLVKMKLCWVGRAPALHGLWRFHCPHLRRQYIFNDSLYLFSFDILRLINPVLYLKFT